MSVLRLPERIAGLLGRKDSSSQGWRPDEIFDSLAGFGGWLEGRPAMPFFPDYSDHGVLHFQRVLDLCDFLVADYDPPRQSCWKALTPNDAAILIQAVLLHDVGMHLDPEGFRLLVTESPGRVNRVGSGLHWPHEWESFLSQASRWDDRVAQQIYGSLIEECDDRPRFRRPSFDADRHDKMDRLLIGEFLRRHHAAIALDVAVSNLPTGIGFPDMPLRGSLAEISGVIAKSHGEPIRTAVRQAESRFDDARFTSHVHITYLMALLRIADFLHLHAERAESDPNDIAKKSSPISRRELRSHQAIEEIHFDRDPDKEAVYVEIARDPQRLDRASTLLNIRENWLDGLAAELNQAWGEIGRAYSRYPTMGDLGLAVRRVNTNASSPALESRLPFYPTHAAFRAADSGFLKLLVEPLYGDRPEIGVRELMQNAIDAVRERRDYDLHREAESPEWPQLCELAPNADVVVSLCARREDTPPEEAGGPPRGWERWVEVQDRGIGMTPKTVVENLLVAGASYRDTMPWKQQHQDEEGNSRVLRSGRFGVGALAAFLLGPEIEVITRHVTADEGVRIVAKMADENIDLRRCEAPVGTTVRVEASENTAERMFDRWGFGWDWYRLEWPRVFRVDCTSKVPRLIDMDDEDEEDVFESDQPYRRLPASLDDPLPHGWRRIEASGFEDIQWTFGDYAPALSCNGIVVVKNGGVFSESGSNSLIDSYRSIPVGMPCLSVFDPDCRLPLNLARDRLQTPSLPFQDELGKAVIRDLIAHSLVLGPEKHLSGKGVKKAHDGAHPGCRSRSSIELPSWVYLDCGFVLADLNLLAAAKLQRLVFLVSFEGGRRLPTIKPPRSVGVFGCRYEVNRYAKFSGAMDWVSSGANRKDTYLNARLPHDAFPRFDRYEQARIRVLCASSDLKALEKSTGQTFLESAGAVHQLLDGKLWIVDSHADLPPVEESLCWELATGKVCQRPRDLGLITEWYFADKQPAEGLSDIATAWSDFIDAPCIPYRLSEREEMLPRAFEQLAPEIKAWRRESAATRHEKEMERETRRAKLAEGGYPNFTHGNQIKRYLKSEGIQRSVRVSRYLDYMQLYDGPVYSVYAIYSRAELKAVNPDTPDTGDPFVVKHPHDQLPELEKIQHLLKGTNTSLSVLGPERDA